MPEIRHLGHDEREFPGHVIVIKVEDLKILELGKLGRKSAVEHIVRKVEESEASDDRNPRGNGSRELINSDGEIRKKWEVSDVVGERAGEVKAGEVKSNNVAAGVAGDAGPGAVAGGGVPGGKRRLGVVRNGCFKRKKGTVLRHGSREGMVEMEMEKEK